MMSDRFSENGTRNGNGTNWCPFLILGILRNHCSSQLVQSNTFTTTSPLCVPTNCAWLTLDDDSAT